MKTTSHSVGGWLTTPSRASGDWLRETQRECFMIGCEHTQQGRQWLDENAQRVTSADVVLLYSCCTHTPLVCCTPETLCDWPGVDDLMRWKQQTLLGVENKGSALFNLMNVWVSDLHSILYQCDFILVATLWFQRPKITFEPAVYKRMRVPVNAQDTLRIHTEKILETG